MKWLRMILSVRLFLVVTVLFLTWQIWMFVKPRPRPLTPAEIAAVAKACEDVVDRIQAAVPAPARIGVATFVGDDTGDVTAALKLRLATVSGYSVLEESPIRRFLGDVSAAVANASNHEEVMKAGQAVSIDVVVAGRVLSISQTNDAGRVALQAYAYDTRPGLLAVNETLDMEWTPTWTQKAAAEIAETSPLLRWAIWLVLAGLLPWLTGFGVVWAIEKKTNAASLALILGYIVADMALFLLLFRPALDQTGSLFKLLLVLALCAAYDFWAAETIAARHRS